MLFLVKKRWFIFYACMPAAAAWLTVFFSTNQPTFAFSVLYIVFYVSDVATLYVLHITLAFQRGRSNAYVFQIVGLERLSIFIGLDFLEAPEPCQLHQCRSSCFTKIYFIIQFRHHFHLYIFQNYISHIHSSIFTPSFYYSYLNLKQLT